MKIFNWVHRRLHPKVLNDQLPSVDEHNIEPVINEADTQALLKEVAVVDVLGGWSNVMLAVGTLGFDTMKPFNHEQGYLTLAHDVEEDQTKEDGDDDKGKYRVEHEELNPLMYASLDDNFNGIAEPISDIAADTMASKPDIFSVTAEFPSNQVVDLNTVVRSDNQKKGDRITLADLFLADSVEIDVKTKDQTKTMLDASKEISIKKKHRLSFAKKIIPQVIDHDSGPLKNLQRLMRRMMKRKVYPDFDVKNILKSDGQKGSTTEAGCSVKHKRETSDSVSLLPCQGAGV